MFDFKEFIDQILSSPVGTYRSNWEERVTAMPVYFQISPFLPLLLWFYFPTVCLSLFLQCYFAFLFT